MFRFQCSINSAQGPALDGVLVYVCTQPANTTNIPPSPLASLFTDSTGSTPLANPISTDGLGNFFFYAASGTYTLVYYDALNRIPKTVFPDQILVSPGSGSVTSIAVTVPAQMTVAGSPVTTAGTIALDFANENANLIFAGPASGPAAKPTFRAAVTADLPAGVGSVTSVGLALTINNALITASVSNTPITSSGNIGLTLSLANQLPNTFFAGPPNGVSLGVVSARLMVPADLPPQVQKSFSATPTFDASAGSSFTITLTGSVTSSSVTNATAGQLITMIIAQDGTGNHPFVFPTDFRGASVISPDANSTSVQQFVRDGVANLWRAVGPGSTMPAS